MKVLPAAAAPAAGRMARTKVGPLAQVGLSQNHGAGFPQSLDDKRVARRDGPGKSERAGGGHHSVSSVDVVLDKYRNAVQRAAHALLTTFFVERVGDRERIRVDLDHG